MASDCTQLSLGMAASIQEYDPPSSASSESDPCDPREYEDVFGRDLPFVATGSAEEGDFVPSKIIITPPQSPRPASAGSIHKSPR